MGTTCAGVGAPGDVGRRSRRRRCTTSLSKAAPSSVTSVAPVVERPLPVGALRRVGGGPRGRRRWCRRGRPCRRGRRPRSTCCRRSSGLPSTATRMAEPRYSMTWPMPPPVPMRPMMARMTSLAVTPAGRSPSTVTAIVPRPLLRERLGGEDVLDLAGADAEGQGAEGAVGGGVAVAAHDRHARLGQALLGADDVHDALVAVAHGVERGCRTPRSSRRAPPSGCGDRVGDRAGRCRWWGRCGPSSPRSGRGGARAARRGAARRRPAAT